MNLVITDAEASHLVMALQLAAAHHQRAAEDYEDHPAIKKIFEDQAAISRKLVAQIEDLLYGVSK